MLLVVLEPDAQFSMLPFDKFVLEKWDYDRSVEQDQTQWNEIARLYLNLDARGRHPYYDLDPSPPSTPPGRHPPTQDQIDRVLVPHQTIRERNFSLESAGSYYSPLWLRTCYSPELADVHSRWRLQRMQNKECQVFDDESLYSPFAANWSGVLQRVPAIADTIQFKSYETGISRVEDDMEAPSPGEEYKCAAWEAVIQVETMLYLVDEEALRTGWLKILWLDIHGNCVWNNKLDPQGLEDFTGRMHDGPGLADLYNEWDINEGFFIRGADISRGR